MLKNKILKILSDMGIDTDANHERTFDDYGLDSQEVIELQELLEKSIGKKLVTNFVNKNLSIDQLEQKLQEYLALVELKKQHFQYSISENIRINAEIETVYGALHNIQQWSEFLPHVQSIDVLYDDDTYQEFLMNVRSEQDSVLSVRSVRKCDKDNMIIDFFQPTPPPYLTNHCGNWLLQMLDKEVTIVTTNHYWNVNKEHALTMYPYEETYNAIEHSIGNTLRNHAKLALSTWKAVLENSRIKYNTGGF